MSDDQWGAGDRSNWSNHGFVMVGAERRPLIYGEHPHSRSDNRHYVEMDGEAVGFDGHRILIGVEITASNYLKGSHYSGSEVRKGGSGKITADGEVVFEFFTRDTRGALLRAHHLIGELSEHSSGWLSKEARDRLVGRKVYYRGVPAVITRLIDASMSIAGYSPLSARRRESTMWPSRIARAESAIGSCWSSPSVSTV